MATENTPPQPSPEDAPEQAPAEQAPAGKTIKKLTPPIDVLAERMRIRVNKGFLNSNFSAVDRNSINQLAGTLALRSDEKEKAMVRLEYLLCFIEGDIDWKKRYEEVFGLKPPTEKRSAQIPRELRDRGRIAKASGLMEEPEF